MKILHILDHSIPLHSGYTFRSKAILEHQQILGWETEHVTSIKHNIEANPEQDEELVDGLHFYRTHQQTSVLSRLPLLNQLAVVSSLRKRLLEILPLVKPDIIHAHSPSLNGMAALQVARQRNIPVVYEIRAFWEDAAVDHGTTQEGSLRYRITRMLETRVARRANAVTTICEGLKQDLIDRGIAREKITVIPNAVDISKFNIASQPDKELSHKLNLDNKIVIGFIGSFYAYEGLDLLLEALPKIKAEVKNVKIMLVGGGPQEQTLKQLAERFGIQDDVVFVGRVPHAEVNRYYDLLNILVYPRKSMRLTELVTPLKPLEAMAQRRLLVASDVGGHRELIKDGVTGSLFKAGDSLALAKSVVDLIEAEPTWDTRLDAGREFVLQERNWTKSVSYYREIYRKLVDTNKYTTATV